MNNFESHIYGSKPVVVDFFAEWCGPCKLMTPVLQQVKDAVGDRVTVLKMDIDKNPGFTHHYAVQAVPTLIIFKDGHVLWRKSGVVPAHEILEHLNTVMS
jgi:thioredoxin 1